MDYGILIYKHRISLDKSLDIALRGADKEASLRRDSAKTIFSINGFNDPKAHQKVPTHKPLHCFVP